jgi:hypothetical protein
MPAMKHFRRTLLLQVRSTAEPTKSKPKMSTLLAPWDQHRTVSATLLVSAPSVIHYINFPIRYVQYSSSQNQHLKINLSSAKQGFVIQEFNTVSFKKPLLINSSPVKTNITFTTMPF